MKNIISDRPKPVLLVILDGWGITQPFTGNAISQASTPNFNDFIARYPAMVLSASGEAVGLPWGEHGNSEVGHLNLGLGRIVYQELPLINRAITDNSFFANQAFLKAIEHAKNNNSCLHLLGLVSNCGVHSSVDHLQALLALAKEKGLTKVCIHAILDGRDTTFNSGINFIKELERFINEYKVGRIATVSGRFYAMDRDNRWDRIEKAYNAIVLGEGKQAQSAIRAIDESYSKKIYDEEFFPTVIVDNDKPVATIKENDSVIFFNFRADRAREITKSLVLPGFNKFSSWRYLKDLYFVCMTEYEKDLPVEVAFYPEIRKNSLGEVISEAGLRQLRIAETEKYAHVTYFFNGGRETRSPGEDHILIPSPRVSNYADQPEMSAYIITEKLVSAIMDDDKYDFILVNYANSDMIGHTGNIQAAIKAVETVDKCLQKLYQAVISKNGIMLITADHGNAEVMFNMQTGMIHKEHTSNPVPFVVVGNQFEGKTIGFQESPGNDLSLLRPQGILSDVAPTILTIMNIKKPKEMTGRSLV
jgi:2,3-bisphosphoglycerate-independent phosphoglycerate mutase